MSPGAPAGADLGTNAAAAVPVSPRPAAPTPTPTPTLDRLPITPRSHLDGGLPAQVNGAPEVYTNGAAAPLAASAAPVPPAPVLPAQSDPSHGPMPDRNGQCTAPQLRRFIKSRPYVPMHELRRRFGIDGEDDDVTSVRLEPGWVFLGLPRREGSLLGELLKAGEIGYELSLDPRTPIVIGVYPMRPIPRG
jgi:hypothetical protein